MKVKGGAIMTIRIQKLTFWFYIWFFCSLSYLSSLSLSLNQPGVAILSQLILFLIFLAISLLVLSKRQKAIKELKKVPSFQKLYRHEMITACLVAFSSVIDLFFLTNLSKIIYLIAVFYHLYWFMKNYSLSMNQKK